MADIFSAEKRSAVMRSIRSKDTKPEMRIRSALHRLGFRYTLHDKSLPGSPDLVLSKYRSVIQVRGCFWHGHTCRSGHIPKSNQSYWSPKLLKNVSRDRQNDASLRRLGYSVIVVWECECTEKKLDGTVASVVRRLRRRLTCKRESKSHLM
jgi:DNA mismatch endonuclease (patch repair protein)